MRIRQIKPQFFMDKDMAALSWRQRVIYVGLWLVADDAGWFDCDYEDIARELFGFDSWKIRERWVLDDLQVLQERGHVEIEPCGHGLIPTLPEHQRFGGQTKRVYTTLTAHEARCLSQVPAGPRVPPRVPALGNRYGREKVGNGKGTVEGTVDGGFAAVRDAAEAAGLT